MIFFVLMNEIVITSDEYPISLQRLRNLEYLNIFLTLIFLIETIIRLISSGFEDFAKMTKLNIMDAIIVVISIVDVIVSQVFLP